MVQPHRVQRDFNGAAAKAVQFQAALNGFDKHRHKGTKDEREWAACVHRSGSMHRTCVCVLGADDGEHASLLQQLKGLVELARGAARLAERDADVVLESTAVGRVSQLQELEAGTRPVSETHLDTPQLAEELLACDLGVIADRFLTQSCQKRRGSECHRGKGRGDGDGRRSSAELSTCEEIGLLDCLDKGRREDICGGRLGGA